MIVRIASEGQYEIPSRYLDKLNAMDNKLVDLVGLGKAERFSAQLRKMVEFVRKYGSPVSAEDLRNSDVIMPPPDITLDEAKKIFVGEGLVPG